MIDERDRGGGTNGNIGAAVVDVRWAGRVGVEREIEGAGVGIGGEAKLWFNIHGGIGENEACLRW